MTINKELQPQRGTDPTPSDPEGPARRAEALAASPDAAADEAEREMPPTGVGEARTEALATNPDAEADEAEREWDPAGHGAKRAEALAANPDNAENEAERLLREPPELSRG